MERLVSDRAVGLATKGFAALLLVFAIALPVLAFLDGGVDAVPLAESALFLVGAVIIVVGVFRDTLASPPIQAAIALWLVAYGAYQYATRGAVLWGVMALLGLWMLVATLRRR